MRPVESMKPITRILIAALAVLAVLAIAGCADNSGRDRAQEIYDQKAVEASGQAGNVSALEARFNQTMTIPEYKSYLLDYYVNLTTLRDDINATNQAGEELKKYLAKGSADYSTVTANEQTLQSLLDMYVGKYNQHATSYNNNPGKQYGSVPLI